MSDLIKVSVQGALPGGEKWSVNPVWRLTTGAVVSFAECTAIVAAINAVTVPPVFLASWNTTTTVTGCRVEARTAGGLLEALAEGNRGAPVPGTGGSGHPFQTSIVSTLRTSAPGGSGRGRLYWPATGMTLDNNSLRVFGTIPASFAAGVKTYLAALTTAIDANIDETVALAVWSRTNSSLASVTSISVGDVLDTQRRRRDKVVETIASVTYP